MGDQGQKRKADGNTGGGKNKRQYFSGAGNREKTLPLGTRGVIVSTVSGKETQAGHEAIILLTEAYEALRPEQAQAAHAPAAGGDIAAALASEVAELKDNSKKLFALHSPGLNSMVYVEYRDAEGPSPTQLVARICEEARDTQTNRSRYCCRFHPVEQQCYASQEKIEELAAKLVEQHFPGGEGVEPIQFAVQYEHRASPQLDRMAVIDAFAKRVPAPHKVNLSQPQQTILVNLVKNVCAVAVIPQYKQLMKLNLRSLTGQNDEQLHKSRARGGGGSRSGKAEAQQQQGEKNDQEAPATAEPAAEAEASKEAQQPAEREPAS